MWKMYLRSIAKKKVAFQMVNEVLSNRENVNNDKKNGLF